MAGESEPRPTIKKPATQAEIDAAFARERELWLAARDPRGELEQRVGRQALANLNFVLDTFNEAHAPTRELSQ